jgi:nicotinamide mononucleotide transporter
LGYWFTAVVYAAFTVIALVGWKRWYASHRSAL